MAAAADFAGLVLSPILFPALARTRAVFLSPLAAQRSARLASNPCRSRQISRQTPTRPWPLPSGWPSLVLQRLHSPSAPPPRSRGHLRPLRTVPAGHFGLPSRSRPIRKGLAPPFDERLITCRGEGTCFRGCTPRRQLASGPSWSRSNAFSGVLFCWCRGQFVFAAVAEADERASSWGTKPSPARPIALCLLLARGTKRVCNGTLCW